MIPKFNSPDFQYIEPTYKDSKYCGLTSVKSQIVSTNTFNHRTDFCYSYKTQKDVLSMEIQQKNVLMFLVSKSLPPEFTLFPQAYIFLEVVTNQCQICQIFSTFLQIEHKNTQAMNSAIGKGSLWHPSFTVYSISNKEKFNHLQIVN